MSSFNAGSIHGGIFLDHKPAQTATQETVKSVRTMKTEVDGAMKGMAANGKAAWGDTLHDIKGQLGKSSVFGQTLKMAAGGGAVMALNMAAEKFKEMTAKAVEFVDAVRKGEEGASQLADRLVSAVPIIGTIYEGMQNIGEMFTPSKADMATAEAELKETAHVMAEHKSLMQQTKEQAEEYRLTLRGIAQELSLLGKKGIARDFQQIYNETQNNMEAALKGKGKYAGLKEDQIKPYEDAQRLMRGMGGKQPHLLSEEEARKKLMTADNGDNRNPLLYRRIAQSDIEAEVEKAASSPRNTPTPFCWCGITRRSSRRPMKRKWKWQRTCKLRAEPKPGRYSKTLPKMP